MLKDLEDIQIAHHHQSEHEFQSLAVGIVELVLGVKTKRNALLHTVDGYHHQKVRDAKIHESVYESVLKKCIEECIEECIGECIGECLRECLQEAFWEALWEGF